MSDIALTVNGTKRTVKVDLSKLKPDVTAQWFDPTDGSMRPAAAPFATPDKNAAGDHDWVLVFTSAAAPTTSTTG